jgi:ribosomal protein L16/L10AE
MACPPISPAWSSHMQVMTPHLQVKASQLQVGSIHRQVLKKYLRLQASNLAIKAFTSKVWTAKQLADEPSALRVGDHSPNAHLRNA